MSSSRNCYPNCVRWVLRSISSGEGQLLYGVFLPSFEWGIVSGRVDWSWRDEVWLQNGDNRDATMGDLGLLSARLSFQNMQLPGEWGSLEFALWGKNLLDEEYYEFGIDFDTWDYLDERVVDQLRNCRCDCRALEPGPGAHRLRSLEGAPAPKYAESSEQGGSIGVEELVGPVDGGFERLVASRSTTAASPEQLEPLIEPFRQLLHGQRGSPGGGEFDRQRQPIQSCSQLGHCVRQQPVHHRQQPLPMALGGHFEDLATVLVYPEGTGAGICGGVDCQQLHEATLLRPCHKDGETRSALRRLNHGEHGDK